MPNHCENKIEIKGSKKDIVAFWNGIKKFHGHEVSPNGEMSILRSYLPMPSELLNTANANKNWYDWALENWGSKWGDYDTDLDLNRDSITGYYLSAWGPCNAGILKVSSLFPLLTFTVEYEEPGNCFRGKQVCVNGEEIENWSEEYEPDDEDED